MSIKNSYNARIQVAKETSYGVQATPVYKTIGYNADVTINETNENVIIHGTGHRKPQTIVGGKYNVTGSFSYPMQEASFMWFALGEYAATSPVASDPIAGVYKHQIRVFDTIGATYLRLPSFFLNITDELGTPDQGQLIKGVKVNTVGVTWGLDQPVTLNADWVGQKATATTSAQTVTEYTETPYMLGNAGVITTINADDVKTVLTDINFNMNNTLDLSVYGLGSRTRTDLPAGPFTVDGSATLNFDGLNQYEDFLSSAASPTEPGNQPNTFDVVIMAANEVAASETVAFRGIKFTIKNAVFNTRGLTRPTGGGKVTESFNFDARDVEVDYWDATAADTY